MPGEFTAGTNEGPHLRTSLHHVSLIQIVGLRTEYRVEVRHNGGRGVGKRLVLLDEDDRVGGVQGRLGKFDGQVPGGNAVAFLEWRRLIDAFAVEDGTVLAAKVLHLPGFARTSQGEMLARQSGVVGIAKFIGARPAKRDAIAIERHRDILAIDVADYQFAGRNLRQEVSVTSLTRMPR